MSDNSAIRDYLFECVNDENTSLVRDSVECLMLFFQWDVLKIRKNPEECSSYEEMYNKLTSTFIEHLDSSDEEVRKAAIVALSSVYALQPIIKAEYAILSEDVIRQYCETFHTIKEKTPEFFDLAVRPIVWGTVPLKYAAHFLVYVCVDEMKASIQAAWQEIKKYAPIDGSEVNGALKKLEIAGMGTGQIALARKYISKKFRIEEVKEEETKKSDESDDEPKESFASH